MASREYYEYLAHKWAAGIPLTQRELRELRSALFVGRGILYRSLPVEAEEELGRRQRRGEALVFRDGKPSDELW